MINSSKVAKRYAKALLDYSVEKAVEDAFFQEISSVVEVVRENPDLRALLHSPIVRMEIKRKVLQEVFSERSATLNLLIEILVENKRVSDLYDIAREYVIQYNRYKEKTTAYLTTAVELSESLKAQFVQKAIALSGGKKITLESRVEPQLIGGFILRIDDLQYNASIAHKLYGIKEQLSENVY
ncbi:MAG: ATP synthase F1 subunit delta [Capnocytophaga granulosa]